LLDAGWAPVDAYRAIVVGYAVIGVILAAGFWMLDREIEAPPREVRDDGVRRRLGLGRSRGVVGHLSLLFSIDAFGGGFVPQSLMAYWFHLQFGVEPLVLRVMVFTHLPSNLLLILVPLMPTLPLAVAVLLLRYTLSQMDVPTRQSYVMAVVEPDERSAA